MSDESDRMMRVARGDEWKRIILLDQRLRVFALALGRARSVPLFFLGTSAAVAISSFSFTAFGKALLPRELLVVLALERSIPFAGGSSISASASAMPFVTTTVSPKVTLLVHLATSSHRPTTVLEPEVDPAAEPAELEGECLLKGVESPRTPIWGVRVDATEIGEAVVLVLDTDPEVDEGVDRKTDATLGGELRELLRSCGVSSVASTDRGCAPSINACFAATERVDGEDTEGSTGESKNRDLGPSSAADHCSCPCPGSASGVACFISREV